MKKLLLSLLLLSSTVYAKTTIIGDSHVGGMKPYLSKHMVVRYKNGSTSKYWLRQPVNKTDRLIIHTGTNEMANKVSPQQWLKNTKAICEKWKVRQCYIVSPSMNKFNYLPYRKILANEPNVIFTCNMKPRGDGVHYTFQGYKKLSRQILESLPKE